MTARTTIGRRERDAFAAHAHAAAVRRVTRTVAVAMLFVGSMFWGVYALITVALPLVVNASGGVLGGGAMTGNEYASRWFAFSLGIVMITALVVNHLAAGGTRRALLSGSIRAAAVTGVVFGAAASALLMVEQAIFGAMGWQWDQLGSALGTHNTWILVTAAAEALAVVVYSLVGMAVAAGYYTAGVWRGTLLVLPGLVLLMLADATTRTGAGDDALTALLGDAMPTSPAVGFGAALVVLALAAGWFWWQLRTVTLRPAR
ncbi:hypothetical protein ACH436_06300 [Isoptericola sp. NPDC019693]|uniref:hypothetical protein n=1 Tax=Isoptericola sp. NPDC019693 TaxID=3364009 RepID=UPI0037B0FD0B